MLEIENNIYWPVEISVDVNIGTDTYNDDYNKPCCAIGHVRSECNTHGYFSRKIVYWSDVYIALYCSLYGPLDKNFSAETINDSIEDDKERTDLYLLTWAKLGYTKGMPSRILNKLKLPKVKKVKIKWR